MTDRDHEEQNFGLETDAEAVVEMVELLAHRRSRQESRKHPRYPTVESLSGCYDPEKPFGSILCGGSSQDGENGGRPRSDDPSSLHLPATETLELIGGFHAVDFSQDGLQVQYECANAFRYSRRRLYLEVAGTTIPISMQWFNSNGGTSRAGVSFAEDLETSPELAGTLVELSDRLIGYLVRHYFSEGSRDSRGIAVFLFLCIMSNLRLRYIQAVSMFNQVCIALDGFLGSSFVNPGSANRLTALLLAAVKQLHGPGCAADPEDRGCLMASVMEHYREYGCSISGKEGRVVFLEKEFLNVMSTSLFFEDLIANPYKGVLTQFSPLQAHFNTLREFEPTLFENEAFSNQFIHYSRAVSSVMDSREALLDLLSNLGNRLSAVFCPQSAEIDPPAGRPATVTGMDCREEGLSPFTPVS